MLRKCLILVFFFYCQQISCIRKKILEGLRTFLQFMSENYYRNLADNIDNFSGSGFYSRIGADADLPREDVQKYILATSDFAKSIQTNIYRQ